MSSGPLDPLLRTLVSFAAEKQKSFKAALVDALYHNDHVNDNALESGIGLWYFCPCHISYEAGE